MIERSLQRWNWLDIIVVCFQNAEEEIYRRYRGLKNCPIRLLASECRRNFLILLRD